MATFLYKFLEERYVVELPDGRKVNGFDKDGKFRLEDPTTGEAIQSSSVQDNKKKFVSTPFARMPSGGFSGLDNHSMSSILWLEYEMRQRGIRIQHARNGGEHRIRGVRIHGLRISRM